MVSVPAHPRRIDLAREHVRAPVHLNDRHKSALEPKLKLTAELQEFIFENSSIRAMRLCSQGYPCRRRGCPWCAPRIASVTRGKVQPVARRHDRVLELTFTTKSSSMLSEAWAQQDRTRRRFLQHSWLSGRCSGWIRETEITQSAAGWHVHDHVLVFDDRPGVLEDIAAAARTRWLDAARLEGVAAGPKGQMSRIHDDVQERVRYVTKGQMRRREPDPVKGRNLAAILAGYKAGLVDDADVWIEFETFFGDGSRRRWRATGGPEFRTWEKKIVEEAEVSVEVLLDPDITAGRKPTPIPLTRTQVPPEYRQLSVMAERAEAARERHERDDRDRLMAEAYAAERFRDETEHASRLARFARHRQDVRTADDASLLALLEGL